MKYFQGIIMGWGRPRRGQGLSASRWAVGKLVGGQAGGSAPHLPPPPAGPIPTRIWQQACTRCPQRGRSATRGTGLPPPPAWRDRPCGPGILPPPAPEGTQQSRAAQKHTGVGGGGRRSVSVTVGSTAQRWGSRAEGGRMGGGVQSPRAEHLAAAGGQRVWWRRVRLQGAVVAAGAAARPAGGTCWARPAHGDTEHSTQVEGYGGGGSSGALTSSPLSVSLSSSSSTSLRSKQGTGQVGWVDGWV